MSQARSCQHASATCRPPEPRARRRPRRATWAPWCLLGWLVLSWLPSTAQAQILDEEQQLAAYLERLGLTDLRITQLELQLSGGRLDTAARSQTARRLADLYSQQLIENLDQKARYDDLSRRVTRLLADYPAARTAALEVLLLQADYQRAEKLIGQWMVEAGQEAARDEALEILKRITPVLDARQDQLRAEVERLLAEAEKRTKVDEQAEKELLRQQTISARASYFTAWSIYYRSLLLPGTPVEDLRRARGIFRRLLDLADDDKYVDYDGEQLGLESPWRSRTLIGLGLCESAVGELLASRDCFKLLASGNAAPRDLRDQADYWYVQGLLNAGQTRAAVEYAQQVVPSLPNEPTQGRVSFCAALVRFAYSDPARQQTEDAKQLAQVGVRGLAKLRQYRVLRDMLTKYGISIDDPRGFLLLWLKGQRLREAADESGRPADYELAAEALKAALADPEAASDVGGAGHCRTEWAWCLYQAGKLSEAAAQYAQAADALRTAGDPAAVESAWMAFAAAHRLWQKDGRSEQKVRDAAEWLKREYPGHEHTRRAEFMTVKMSLRTASVDEQIRVLEAIPPGDPNFVAARQDLCRLRLDEWRAAPPDAKAALAQQLGEAVDGLFAKAGAALSADDQLRLRLMAIETASGQQDWESAARHLQAALLVESPDNEELAAELHYRGLQIARSRNDYDAAQPHVEWFLDHATGSRFEAAGLVAAAKFMETPGAAGELTDEAAARAYQIYQRLSRSWGDTPDVLKSNRNALVAASKVVSLGSRLGHREEALAVCERLLAAYPTDRNFLRSAALLTFEARDFAKSLDHWRTILAGTRVGVAEWYEAKYHQIRCLMEIDRPAAPPVFQQFRILDPDLGPPEWREKFQALEKVLP